MPRDSAPTIPPVPLTVPPEQRPFLESIANALRLRLGQTANELDRSPTLREILAGDFGTININLTGGGTIGGGGGGGAPYDPFTDTTVPTTPTGLTAAAAGPWKILLTWNNPPNPNPGSPPYIAFTEVYANNVDDLNTAVFVGIGYASFLHNVEPGQTWYYWIRFVNYAGTPGPFHPTVNGISATSSLDATATLALLAGQITESELYAALTSRIDLIDVTSVLGQSGLIGAITQLDTDLDTTNTTVSGISQTINDPTTGLATRAAQTEVTQLDTRLDALDGGTASGVSISQLEAGVNGAISDANAAEIAASAAVVEVANVDARVDVIDGGVFASATNIDQITAVVSAPGLANEMTGNPNFTREDLLSPGRPYGVKSCYGSSAPSNISYADAGKTRLRLYSASDANIGVGWPAMKVNAGERYRVKLRYRMITGTINTAGFYVYGLEKDTSLIDGTTHLSRNNGEPGVDYGQTTPYGVSTTLKIISGTDTGNGNAPGNNIGGNMTNRSISALNTWFEAEVEYTPGAGVEWASINILNWTDLGLADLEFDYVYIYQDVASLRGTVETLATTTAGPTGTLAQYTIKVDANGNIAGFGLSSEINEQGVSTSQAIFNVDRFAIVKSDGTGTQVPFVVDGGLVVMDGALIKSASINDASIDTLNGNKIVANSVSAQKLMLDGVTIGRVGDYLVIPNLGVKTAQIGNASITTAKIGDLAVDTLKIAGNAVTLPYHVRLSGNNVCTGGVKTNLATLNGIVVPDVDGTGTTTVPVIITWGVIYRGDNSGAPTVTWTVERSGASSGTIFSEAVTDGWKGTCVAYPVRDDVLPGTYNYTLSATISSTRTVLDASMTAVFAKK